MRRTLEIVFCVLITFYSFAQSAEPELIIGSITGKGANSKYDLTFYFGIEQWEDGKLTTHRRQQWELHCSYPEPATNRQNTWCSLKRVVINEELTPGSGAIIGTTKHDSSDGTLRLINADWERGRLDFTIVYSDRGTTEVMLGMKREGNIFYLDSFKATAITRGTFVLTPLTTIEYRIPKYTYTLNVPVVMRGLKSTGAKEWDEMVATLSKEDQKAWEEFWANISTRCKNLNKIFAEQPKKLDLVFAEELTKCLPNSKISAAGQKKIIDSMKKSLTSKNSRREGIRPIIDTGCLTTGWRPTLAKTRAAHPERLGGSAKQRGWGWCDGIHAQSKTSCCTCTGSKGSSQPELEEARRILREVDRLGSRGRDQFPQFAVELVGSVRATLGMSFRGDAEESLAFTRGKIH